jgi:hypothetical protein
MTGGIERDSISLKKAAIISGCVLLLMVIAALFAEMYAYPKIISRGNITETINAISTKKFLFAACILSYLLTFILDIIVAWSLYVLLKPVNESLSLLSAWFRIVYTVISIVALQNLVAAYRLIHYTSAFSISTENTPLQMSQFLNAFKSQWYFGLIFFSLHLVLLGALVIKSGYIPKLLGILLIITGMGYSLTTLKPFLFAETNIDFASFTFYGELIFMIWLLVAGRKIKQ